MGEPAMRREAPLLAEVVWLSAVFVVDNIKRVTQACRRLKRTGPKARTESSSESDQKLTIPPEAFPPALVLVTEPVRGTVLVTTVTPANVVGAAPLEVDDPVEAEAADPPVVILNILLCARMAGFCVVEEVIKLIWKPVPVGHAPLG
jgi:hypothetical protein